jgi:tetratricopeptide (TPR) repeat protein
MSSATAEATNEVFCSYAHEDLQYIEAFRSHLRQLEREGIISCWYDGLTGAGQQWHREIEIHLNSANIILLFISPSFLASDFCMETELSIALQRSNRKEALVIPVIVRQCDWQTSRFAYLQALPREGKPIAEWRHRDEAYTEIVKSIRGFVYDQRVPPMRGLLLNLPFHRNHLFTGREEILHSLHTSLETSKETALIQAISGLGGIGKTQTAIEYAYRYQDCYTHIIWLNGESRETIISDVARLAREINTPNCFDQDQNIVARGFLTWLETQRNWLLILDNVEDIALARSYLPKGNQGHLLLTTRRQALGGAIQGIFLNGMNEEEGGAFLLKRAKQIATDVLPKQIPAKEMQSAMHLSRVLGGLPLALDQAGGYIERKQCSLERYQQIYEQAHERLLAERGFLEDTTDYKYTVATTWSLSFRQVAQAKHGQAATHLLRLCAFLAPDNIPVPMLEKVPASLTLDLFGPDLGQVSPDPVQIEEVLEALLKYSLIRREDNSLFIHRLVQTVLRNAMTEEERALWIERAIHLMNRFFPDPNDPANWPVCRYLLAHALICAEWATRTGIRTELLALLLNRTGYFLNSQGSYRQAEPLYEHAFEIRRAVLGEQHLDTAQSLNNLAALYQIQSKYEEAELLFKQTLKIRRAVLGEQHRLTAWSLNNLGELYRSQGRYEEAEPLYKQALKIRRAVLGEQHPDIALSLNSLGLLYQSQGRYEEAERSYKEALAIWQAVLGEQHPDTAQGLNNLGELYRIRGRYEEAEPLLKMALAIWQVVLGEQHRLIAMSLNNLGLLYLNQGRKEAALFFERTLSILVNVLGKDHPDTQDVFYHYVVSLINREG